MGNNSITDILSGTTQTQEFTYDALNRLVTAEAYGGIGGNYAEETYEYDAQGRIESMPGLGDYTYLREGPIKVRSDKAPIRIRISGA
jgi:YD repeat-containing protein